MKFSLQNTIERIATQIFQILPHFFSLFCLVVYEKDL